MTSRLSCVVVLNIDMTSCPAEGYVMTSSRAGYLSNTLQSIDDSYTDLGRRGCPWVIRGQRGQRVQLSLILLHSLDPLSTTCPRVNLSTQLLLLHSKKLIDNN